MKACPVRMFLTWSVLVLMILPAEADDWISFGRDIRPILSHNCCQWHGPDAGARQAELRLDKADDNEGPFQVRDGTRAVVSGDPDASVLWQRIVSSDPGVVMPPPSAMKKPLSEPQLEIIRQWIVQGAEYESYWAFTAPQPQQQPTVRDTSWSSDPIDLFVMARLEQKGLKPQPKADRRTLIRRASLDLTGLPPTLADIESFLNDASPNAWEKVVDRLIASPQYGEHMARSWLDLVRFADTNGMHHDHYREITLYRDWVIRSFNDNLPYRDFVRFQIAGDLYDEPTIDQQIATGFNRLHLVIDVGTAIPDESFFKNVVDRVTAVGTAFMGMTLSCAVCHDHKYDPLSQKDFYQLYAFFNNDEASPETPSRNTDDHKRGLHAPYLQLPSPEQEVELTSLAAALDSARRNAEELKNRLKQLRSAGKTEGAPDAEAAAPDAEAVSAAEAELARAESEVAVFTDRKNQLEGEIPVTMVMKERSDVRPTFIHVRGAYDRPGEAVERNTPGFLPPMPPKDGIRTRMDLALWLTDPLHPLTARVAVNRFWQQFFGVGLVRTSEDFGMQGESPSHPELLDELTVRFVESGWNVKELVKSFVMSETWLQSSAASSDVFAVDAQNRLLARGTRRRLDAEIIRDQILSFSGLINPTLYGRSVKPPQPGDLWKSVSMPSSSTYSFEADTGEKIHRRSLYTFWKRAMPPPQMTIFDAPTREACIARRELTNTPLQALVLMNESEYFRAAGQFARRMLQQPELDERTRLSRTWETVTAQIPDEAKLSILSGGLGEFRSGFEADETAAETVTSQFGTLGREERIELAAWTMLMNSLFSLDETRTRE